MTTDRRDRVLDWEEELSRIIPKLQELPAGARRAVRDTVAGFLREDEDAGVQPGRLVSLAVLDQAA